MAKITKAGGASVAGFTDDTERTRAEAADRAAAGDPDTEQPEPEVDEQPEPELDDEQEQEPAPVLRPLPFDPSAYTASDVNALLKDMDPADAELVLTAERAGLRRKTIIGE